MTPHPPLASLDRWLEQAVAAGCQAVKPGADLVNAALAVDSIKKRNPDPHFALINAYFTARTLAAAEPEGIIPPEDFPLRFREAVEAWAEGEQPPMPALGERPPYADQELDELEYVTALAVAEGYLSEGVRESSHVFIRLARDAIEVSRNGPAYRIVMASYFGARTTALSRGQPGDPETHGPEWFQQAVQNFLNEQKTL